jgi:hypothetical protein
MTLLDGAEDLGCGKKGRGSPKTRFSNYLSIRKLLKHRILKDDELGGGRVSCNWRRNRCQKAEAQPLESGIFNDSPPHVDRSGGIRPSGDQGPIVRVDLTAFAVDHRTGRRARFR